MTALVEAARAVLTARDELQRLKRVHGSDIPLEAVAVGLDLTAAVDDLRTALESHERQAALDAGLVRFALEIINGTGDPYCFCEPADGGFVQDLAESCGLIHLCPCPAEHLAEFGDADGNWYEPVPDLVARREQSS